MWIFRKRLQSFFRSSLWVVPALSTLAAFASAPLVRALDRALGLQLLGYSPEGARALAIVVAQALLSFVVLFFSVLLLTVQIASSTLSPRVIARPFRSRTLKSSLGLFIFTFVYSMSVVARGAEQNIGQLAITLVIALTIISVCVFLYVVEHVSKQLRPVTVMAEVASDGHHVIRAVYPTMMDSCPVPVPPAQICLGVPSREIHFRGKPGVVLAVNFSKLFTLALQNACTVEVVPEVGDFVATDEPLFRIYADGTRIRARELLQTIALGRERTLEQDPAFAFRIIVDIAAKALSPAINDPTTAVLALDQIHHLLRDVGMRRLGTGLVYDSTKQLRLVYYTPDWEDFVGLAVTEIRQFGGNSTQVVRRMRAMFENLIQVLPLERCVVIRKELELLKTTVERGFTVPQDRVRAELADFQGLGGRGRAVTPVGAFGRDGLA